MLSATLRLSTAVGALLVFMTLSAQELTFKSTTQLVIVNVSAKDKKGQLVEGLTADDFRILEDGKPQKIVAFEFQRLVGDPAPPDMRSEAADSAPGRVRYQDRRLLVMFFDQASLPPAEFWRAQDAALKFVREQITPNDLIAVMGYTTKLEFHQEFTGDRDQLVKVIGGLTPDSEEAAEGDDEAEFAIFNTDRKLAALQDAVQSLGSLAERKALVYFGAGSGGGTGIENQSQIRSTINAAVRANVVFYTVDARGLTAQAPVGNASVASPGGAGIFSGQAILQAAQQLGGEDETLYRLAKETGGKALVNTNDLTVGLRQAQKDLSSYYILGYYSSNSEPDGKYRRISVEVGRKLAASLDYRKGYFAPKEFSAFTAADRERQLEEALTLGDPVTDLGLALEVNYFQAERNRYFVPVAVKIPGSAIPFPEGGGGTRLDFIVQVKNVTGAVAATVRDDIEIKLAADAAAGLANRTVHYETAFLLAPGPYTMKFVARENLTGRMGTFEAGFFVPDLSTEVDYLPISSVVLSNQREPVDGKVARPPLVQDGEKLVPSVTRVFRTDQQMYAYFEKYHASAAKVRISLYRGKVKAFESEPLDVAEGAIKASVSLANLQPGRYTCQISVLAPPAGKFAFWRAPIAVLPSIDATLPRSALQP